MQAHPLRLSPGDDLRASIEAAMLHVGAQAAFVLQGIGSLSVAQLRFAAAASPSELRGDLEIVTLAGRFHHRELRVGGLERWPELYELVGSR